MNSHDDYPTFPDFARDVVGMRLVLHAPNVHQGGGASLLTALIQADLPGVRRHLIVDDRFPLPSAVADNLSIERVPQTLPARWRAERTLRALARPDDVVLCLGNLPPIFRLRARTILFLQNRHLLEPMPKGFPFRARVRNAVEKLWLRSRLANAAALVVQTPTMRKLVQSTLGVDPHVLPFIGSMQSAARSEARGKETFDFVYVSSGEPHKNHRALVEAWRLLARDNIRPRLAITLSEERDRELCVAIAAASKEHGLNITNLGVTSAAMIHELYGSANAFIFPSLGESFGLPLLEAAAAGLPIIAPEADYVRDVVDPVETFDPTSPLSIARAIKRYLHLPEARKAPGSPTAFMTAIVSGEFGSDGAVAGYTVTTVRS